MIQPMNWQPLSWRRMVDGSERHWLAHSGGKPSLMVAAADVFRPEAAPVFAGFLPIVSYFIPDCF